MAYNRTIGTETSGAAVGSKDTHGPGGPEHDEDAALMLSFQAGDDAAFATLVRRYQGRLVSLAMRYLGSSADAEDLAQEVFLRVYRARESYRPSARFSTWVYRITVNASLNHIRGRRVRRGISAEMPGTGADGAGQPEFPDESAPSPPEELEKDELTAAVREIVEGLPERQRLAILLNKYEGLSYEDTAAAMELSIPAVKSLLTRARMNVKERILPYL